MTEIACSFSNPLSYSTKLMIWIISLPILLAPTIGLCQNTKLLGSVLSKEGKPLIQATLIITPYNIQLDTDEKGSYLIEVPLTKYAKDSFEVKVFKKGYKVETRHIAAKAGMKTEIFYLDRFIEARPQAGRPLVSKVSKWTDSAESFALYLRKSIRKEGYTRKIIDTLTFDHLAMSEKVEIIYLLDSLVRHRLVNNGTLMANNDLEQKCFLFLVSSNKLLNPLRYSNEFPKLSAIPPPVQRMLNRKFNESILYFSLVQDALEND